MATRILHGDCRDVLPTLAANSVHCVVTSPPYYGLRDYGVAGQIGLEATPGEYIRTLVAVFCEVRRVLRDDGTCWVNMGDSYSSGSGGDRRLGERDETRAMPRDQIGAKPKDLLMMPARLALALQADGWWLRSDIIWAKPNPMPEGVSDRPTSAHEHVFLLSKRATYWYDADAVREEATHGERFHGDYRDGGPAERTTARNGRNDADNVIVGRNLRNVWTIATAPFPEAHFATFPPALAERCIKAGCPAGGMVLDPFAGAGTTLLVADRLQRHAVGIELNADYAAMSRARITNDAPLLAEVAD